MLVARRLGDWGVTDAELTKLLDPAADDADGELAVAAAVSAARVGGSTAPAVALLEVQLAGRTLDTWQPADWRTLPTGPAAAPLLPLVEGFRDAACEWTRMHAAEAHRITRDPEGAGRRLGVSCGLTRRTVRCQWVRASWAP
ncbi:hypothetical protein AB0D12_36750 [Streptomyces sp. NPDC048479]|uniref:hypothetical protein n=1 Tax=Streptomyces sp. NPDC048479 TaxID=3154725 RepID=UPI0034204E6B